MKKLSLFIGLLLATVSAFGQARFNPEPTDIIVRPANATTYAANDVVSDTTGSNAGRLLVFHNVDQQIGRGGYVTGVTIIADTVNVANASFTLYIIEDSSSVTITADNAQYVLTYAIGKKIAGKIEGITLTTEGTGSTGAIANVENVNLAYKTVQGANGFGRIYGILLADAAYVPKVSGLIWIKLKVISN